MNTRRILLPALCAALVLIAAAGGFLLWPDSPPAPPGSSAGAAASGSIQRGSGPGALPMPDLDEILRRTAPGAIDENAERMERTIAEAQRRVADDPRGALEWAAGLGKEEQASATEQVLSAWAALNPAEAFDAALFLDGKNPALRSRALATVLTEWAAKDPAAAWKNARTLPSDSKDRALIEMRIAMTWARTDAVAASKALQEGAALTGFYSELAPAFGTVANALAGADIEAAKTWALGLPQGPAQSGAVSAIVANWFQKEPAATAAWLNELPPGAARDAAVMLLVATGTDIAPADGLRWAETIGQPALRTTQVSQIALRWLGTQPAEAKAWLAESTVLTDKQKQELLDLAEKLPPPPSLPSQAQAR